MPTSTRSRLAAALALGVVITLTACTPPGAPSPGAASAAPTAPSRIDLSARLVAQEGLAIALASNVLQSQLQLIGAAVGQEGGCHPLPGGGATQILASSVSGSTTTLTLGISYDGGCAQPYMTSDATVTESGDTFAARASVAYTGVDGSALGTMTTDANAAYDESGIRLEGLGTFVPAAGGVTVSLGLACQSQGAADDAPWTCSGGIAQDFPSLGVSLGSITPLTLHLQSDVALPITFEGSGSTTDTGTPGELTIVTPDHVSLALQGGASTAASIATTGQAGSFSLFPPAPTGWTVTDAADDVTFTISVIDDTTRQLRATVTRISTRSSLAVFDVDRSGSGTVRFGDGEPEAVTSWLLAG